MGIPIGILLKFFFAFSFFGAQDVWSGRVCVGSAENENLEKLKVESSLGAVTERQNRAHGYR